MSEQMTNGRKATKLGWVAALSLAAASVFPSMAMAIEEIDTEIYDTRCFIDPMVGGVFGADDNLDGGWAGELRFGCPVGPKSDNWVARKLAWEIGGGYHELDATLSNGAKSDYRRAFGDIGLMLFFDEAFAGSSGNTHWYSKASLHASDIGWLTRNSYALGGSLGFGVIQEIGRIGLRAEIRYLIDAYQGTKFIPDDTFNIVPLVVGLHIPIGPEPKRPSYDDDGDGVPNNRDKCPNTPIGVKVGADGCPLDSDGDGVPDTSDKCPDTPAGVAVDATGCPLDSDGDGVPDARDKCPDTPKGVIVNADGCPLDSDGDGVPDGIDKCPDTLPGIKVNSVGCAIPQVYELRGVHFEYNKARLLIDSQYLLDRVARSLVNEPGAKIMVAGHTCDLGSDAYNTKLSQSRAEAVQQFLVSKGVPAGSLTAKGFGEKQPVKPNTSEENREYNRRVELRILESSTGQPVQVQPQ